VVHELGHALENSNPGIKQAARSFLADRVGDEAPANLREKFGRGYDEWEEGRKDQFDKVFDESRAYYAGKVYPSGSTELVSMGLEQLHANPAHFAAADPEYFRFMVKVLKGGFNK
jgi:hypothetical protein